MRMYDVHATKQNAIMKTQNKMALAYHNFYNSESIVSLKILAIGYLFFFSYNTSKFLSSYVANYLSLNECPLNILQVECIFPK